MKRSARQHNVRRLGILLAITLVPVLIFGAIFFSFGGAAASSHREAPLISKDPGADTTDTYVWIPAGQTENIVLAASWIPGEFPEGGPNYYEWDDNVLYDIFVDVDGDAGADVTYTLSSRVEIVNPDTFLYNVSTIDSITDPDWNRQQFITVTEWFSAGLQPLGGGPEAHITDIVANQPTAPVNIGNKSTPDYAALSASAVYTYTDDNGDVLNIFGGQTDDAFWVDLQVFDLLTLRGQAPPVGYTTPPGNNDPIDSLSGFNVHTLVIEVPISRLVRDGEPVLGVWAGSRRTTMPVLGEGGGTTTQVSRLGMPLVNEVVLPMGLKDTFNAIAPSVDLTVYTLLQESVEDPEVGNLLCALYAVPLPGDTDDDCDTEYTAGVARTGRGDIFDIFLQGMVLTNPFTITLSDGSAFVLPAGYNVNRPATVTPAEMIRINTAISDTLCAPTPSPLGVLGGDACGYPNGRRLTDEVVEISLLAVAGVAYEVLDDRDADFTFDSSLIATLDDGVSGNDMPFQSSFPYFAVAQSGQEHIHTNPMGAMTGVALATLGGISVTGSPLLELAVVAVALGALAVFLLRRRAHAH